jgi:hypothetical protein
VLEVIGVVDFHVVVYFNQVLNITDAVLEVFGVEGALFKE